MCYRICRKTPWTGWGRCSPNLLLPRCCHEALYTHGASCVVSAFYLQIGGFQSGGTRIRTGDTMIFSHMQKPLGMRKTSVGMRISVQGVPLDTTRFWSYCCATVDTAFVTSRGTGSRARV